MPTTVKNIKTYRKELLSAFDRAGGINRVVVLCRDDDIFLNLFSDLVKLMPKEVEHKHDINVSYVSNTPRPSLPPKSNDCKVLDVLEVNLQDTPKDKEGSTTGK